MTRDVANTRLLLMIGAIAASVFFFACSGAGEPEHQTAAPVPAHRAPTSQASLAPVEPVQATQPAHAAGETSAQPAVPAPGEAVADRAAAPEASEPAAEPAEEAEATPKRAEDGVRVYSNQDLKRYRRLTEEFGFRPGTVTVDVSAAQRSKQEQADQAAARLSAAQRDKEISDIRAEIASLDAEMAYLKKRVPSLHNPFLPRAEVSEADRTAEAGLDNAQRLDHVNARMAEAGNRLNELQHRLADLYNMRPSDAPADSTSDPGN